MRLEGLQRTHAPRLQDAAARLRKALIEDKVDRPSIYAGSLLYMHTCTCTCYLFWKVIARHTSWIRVHARTKKAYSAHTKMRKKGKNRSLEC
jgi:hypothetical protein